MKNRFLSFLFITIIGLVICSPILAIAQSDYNYDNEIQEIRNQRANNPVNNSSVCNPTINNLGDVICKIHSLLTALLPVLLLLGVMYFVWGVVQYMIGSDDEAKTKGKDRIIFGLIGLTVIVGLWGLVAIVVTTFDLNRTVDYSSVASTLVTTNSDACDLGQRPKLQNLLNYATCIIKTSVIPLIFALATAMFVWGVVQYVLNTDDEAKKSKGREFMIWGIIALTVMVSVWGLVRILGGTFGVDTPYVPQVKKPTQ